MLLAFPAGVAVGLALGLTGGGGSVFAVPLLVFGLGLSPQRAVPLSLAAVAAVAAVGAWRAAARGLVELRAGALLALGGMATAPVGVWLSRQVAPHTLLTAFALLSCWVAVRLWRSADEGAVVRADPAPDGEGIALCRLEGARLSLTAPCGAALLAAGLATGVLAGLFGIGGGFLIVPALRWVTRLSIHRAVATSLLVIALVGGAGLASATSTLGDGFPWDLALAFLGGGLAGLWAGQRLAPLLAGPRLQRTFSLAVLAMAVATLAQRW
ncbi:MAG: UPF0721 transmembrane protein [Porticoccaceae bacterium]|nr:MAG: UPF0721 transmembrane protein [Porticoccaceae bacterium]